MATDNMEKYRLSMGAAEIDAALQKAKDLPAGGVAKDTVIDESTKESTNVPTTKATYDFVKAETQTESLLYTLELDYSIGSSSLGFDLPIEKLAELSTKTTKIKAYTHNSIYELRLNYICNSEYAGLQFKYLSFGGVVQPNNGNEMIVAIRFDFLFDSSLKNNFIVFGKDTLESKYGEITLNKIEFYETTEVAKATGGGSAEWNGGTVSNLATFNGGFLANANAEGTAAMFCMPEEQMIGIQGWGDAGLTFQGSETAYPLGDWDFSSARVTGFNEGDVLQYYITLNTTLQTGATTTSTCSLSKNGLTVIGESVKYLVYKPNGQDRMIFPLISTNHETPDQTVNLVFGAVQYVAGAGAMYKEIAFGPAEMFSVSGEVGMAISCEGLGNATMAFFALAEGGRIEFWGNRVAFG